MKTKWLGLLLGLGVANSGEAKEFIIKLKGQSFFKYAYTTSNLGAYKVLDAHEAGKLLKIDIQDKKVAKVLAQVLASGEVEYAVENFKLHRFEAPFEISALREQWALGKVNAEAAWKLAGNRGGKRVTVAVIDTGVDYRHESLAANMVQGYDFKANDSDPMDETSAQNPGHGTHCAGIVGATGVVENGISGLAPEVNIMPLRFLGADGSGDLMQGIKAVDFAIEKKADIISASWGATVSASQAQPLIDAVKRASDAGVIFVSAAANDGKNNDKTSVYPANAVFENTITVAASGPNDEKPSWSNYGKAKVALASPGLNIMSTLPGAKYGNLSGTSMATPLVAGLVALLKSQDSTLTGVKIRSLLQSTGAKVSIETACNCRVDAGSAMTALLNKAAYLAPAAGTLAINATQKIELVNASGAVTFTSSNPAVASVDATGTLKALTKGEVTVTAKDAKGISATSLNFYVADGTDNGGGGGDGECPLGDPALCEMLCGIMPDLPFCKQ